jgi:hypothetical protein
VSSLKVIDGATFHRVLERIEAETTLRAASGMPAMRRRNAQSVLAAQAAGCLAARPRCTWWLEVFPVSRFWQSLRVRFPPAVDETVLPRSLGERFADCSVEGGALAATLVQQHCDHPT